jgi:prepilin-type N-terminal cleavage/methylation domain-containing protein
MSHKVLLKKGLTLTEVLVVVAIIGIISALGITTFQRQIEHNRLKEAQFQLVKILERARSFSKRYSYNFQVSFNTTTNAVSVIAVDSSNNPITPSPVSINEVLVNKVRFLAFDPVATTALTYNAPFGRFALGSPAGITLGFSPTSIKADVDVVGVTGLVITRAIQ